MNNSRLKIKEMKFIIIMHMECLSHSTKSIYC